MISILSSNGGNEIGWGHVTKLAITNNQSSPRQVLRHDNNANWVCVMHLGRGCVHKTPLAALLCSVPIMFWETITGSCGVSTVRKPHSIALANRSIAQPVSRIFVLNTVVCIFIYDIHGIHCRNNTHKKRKPYMNWYELEFWAILITRVFCSSYSATQKKKCVHGIWRWNWNRKCVCGDATIDMTPKF